RHPLAVAADTVDREPGLAATFTAAGAATAAFALFRGVLRPTAQDQTLDARLTQRPAARPQLELVVLVDAQLQEVPVRGAAEQHRERLAALGVLGVDHRGVEAGPRLAARR